MKQQPTGVWNVDTPYSMWSTKWIFMYNVV